MLLDQEPPYVSEKEPSRRIMGVGICFGVFVVYPVVARPVVDGALVRYRGAQHEEHADSPVGSVGAVCP